LVKMLLTVMLFNVPQVVRAFGLMEWNDPRILRSLREREKGDGALAT